MPPSNFWSVGLRDDGDGRLLALDPSSAAFAGQEGSCSAVPQNIMFLNGNHGRHGSGLNACLGREQRGIKELLACLPACLLACLLARSSKPRQLKAIVVG
jgi:hypothetical protein